MKILSVGCGRKETRPGVVRVDKTTEVGPDVVWDLDVTPYPFEDSSFSEVECFDVIEHLDNIPKVMEEFHRVLGPGGVLKITTPHFSCANSYRDPTHEHHLSYFSFDYFCREHDLSYYSKARFRIKKREIHFQGSRITRFVLPRIANRMPDLYEMRWAWMFPAWYMYFELEAIKE